MNVKIQALVSAPREQFLRQNETRIRHQALPQHAAGDPAISKWLDGVLFAEDIVDIHEIARDKYLQSRTEHRAAMHHDWALKAQQLKLLCLDQLAHLVG